MRKFYFPLSFTCLLFSFVLLPSVKAGNYTASSARPIIMNSNVEPAVTGSLTLEQRSNLLYDSLNLNKLGLKREALAFAFKGYQSLLKKGQLSNPDILTVCDFSQSSDNKRMYILDVKKFRVLLNTYVAHGKNSGLTYAQRFSNSVRSQQSSLGFYITKNTYFGKHGLSLRLSGQDRGFNDNAERRAVVVHGAPYIGSQHLGASYMGRSFGCPAVPQHLSKKVINLIKEGSCFFIYHPSKKYLNGSRILNG